MSTWIEILVPLTLIVIVITVVILFSERDKSNTGPRRAKADANTAAAVKLLKSFAARSQSRVLGPVTLKKGDKTAQLDGVLVGYFGVLGLKTFGYNGQVYGTPKDAHWLWVSANKRENFDNPIEECALAARIMREALMNAGVRNPDCEATYVFTAPKLELCIPRSVGAMTLKELKSYLRKEKFHADKGYDLDVLCKALEPFLNQQDQ